MNSKDGALHFQPSLELSKLKADVARMKREITGVTTHGKKESALLSSSVRKALLGATGGYLSFIGAKRFVSDIISIRGQFEQLQVAFETMLKSKSKANAMMREVVEFAAKTPFQLTEVAAGTKQLLAYRVEQEKIIPTLKALGDVSAGLSVPIGRLILNYGQVKTAAKLTGRELRDFNMAGVPLIAELAKNLGKTENEISSMVSAGRIGFKDVENAFRTMTSEGGRFSDLMDKQAKTITGRISNIKDNLDKMFNDIGEANQGAINSAISGVGYLIEHYEDIGREIGALITAYGSYRAALIVTAAVQQVVTASKVGMTAAEVVHYTALVVTQKAQALLNKTMLANPYVAVGVAVASLSYLVYKLATAQSSAEKALSDYNEQKREAIKLEEQHKREVVDLISEIRNEENANIDRVRALESLKEFYPKIFGDYDIEKLKLADILKLKKQIAEQDSKNKITATEHRLRSAKEMLANLNMQLEQEAINIGKSKTGSGAGYARIVAKIEYQKQIIKELEKESFNNWKDSETAAFNALNTEGKKAKKRQENLALELEIKQLKAKREEQLKSSGYASEALKIEIKAKQDLVAANEKIIEGYNKETKGYKTAKQEIADWSEKIKELNEERKKLLDAKTSPVKRTEGLKEIDGKIAELEGKIKSRNKNYGKGKEDKSTYDSSTAKREEKRTLEDLENQKQKVLLEMMQEGAAKSLAQLRLNNKLKLQEIQRAYEDEILEIEEKEKEKKKALGKNYSPKEGNENKASVSKAYNMLISNTSKANASNEDALFSQMIKSRNEKREEDLRNYQSYIQSYIDKSKEFEQNIKNLQNQGFSEETIAQVKELQKDSLNKLDEQMEIKEGYIVALANEMIGLGVEELIAKLGEAEAALSVEKNLGKEDYDKKAHYERVQRLQDQIKILKEQLSKAGTTKAKDSSDNMKFKHTVELLRDVNSAANDAIEGFEGMNDSTKDIFKSAFAISSAAITMIGGISQLAQSSAQATQATSKAAAESIKNVERASVILAIISAALQMAQKIASLISGNRTKKKEAEIQRLEKQVTLLRRAYDKLAESIERAYSTDAIELQKKQDENLRRQKALLQRQIRAEEGKKRKKRDNNRIKQWQEEIYKIDDYLAKAGERAQEAIMGRDVKSAIDEFASAWMKAWETGEDKAKAMNTTVKGMVRSAVRQFVSMRMSGEVKKFYESLAQFMEDGILSVAEKRTLQGLENAISNKMQGINKTLDEYVVEKEEEKREVSRKGFAAMNQDMGASLDGRFALMTGLESQSVEISKNIQTGVAFLQDNAAKQLKHLNNIDNNTARLEQVELGIGSINTKLEDIQTKGIKIR